MHTIFYHALNALCILPLAIGAPAHAQAEAPAPTLPDKSAYTLFNPTPRELMREMSTDRPDTTESPNTVDAGHIQLELSFIDWSEDRHNADDTTTRTLAAAPFIIKLGLLNNVDLQIGLDPYTRIRTTDDFGGEETAEGFGDTIIRLKINLWGNDEGDTALAIMPFIKIPTADDDLGNGDVEWGIIVPLSISLPHDFDMAVMLELDVIRNGADDRYVVDLVHTATIAHDIVGDLAGFIEYAGFLNLNHDEDYRAYFDAGLTYALSGDVRLDGGIRVGLTRASDDIGLIAGISLRF